MEAQVMTSKMQERKAEAAEFLIDARSLLCVHKSIFPPNINPHRYCQKLRKPAKTPAIVFDIAVEDSRDG